MGKLTLGLSWGADEWDGLDKTVDESLVLADALEVGQLAASATESSESWALLWKESVMFLRYAHCTQHLHVFLVLRIN